MEKEIDAILESVCRCWDQKDLKEMHFSYMESNLFFMEGNSFLTEPVNKHQGIIHLMLAMLEVRCSKTVSCIREKDNFIRDANSMEENF